MNDSSNQLFVLPRCNEPLEVLHAEATHLLVSKPARLLSVPGRSPENRDCVVSRLQLEYPGATAVHRLDFDTSGVMVVPLSKAAVSNLSRQFQQRSVNKCYTAVVYGQVEQDRGRIDLPIAPDPEARPKYKISPEGKASVTDYQVLERDLQNNTTRLVLYPITGRSHQLRLHLQALGHPILGCEFYAHAEALAMADRLLLHASELSFDHPVTGQRVHTTSAVPF